MSILPAGFDAWKTTNPNESSMTDWEEDLWQTMYQRAKDLEPDAGDATWSKVANDAVDERREWRDQSHR